MSERVHVDEVVLDRRTRALTRGLDPGALSPKAYQFLETLVASRPAAAVESRPPAPAVADTCVVEKNLANLVSEIRLALDDRRPRGSVGIPNLALFIDSPTVSRRQALLRTSASVAETNAISGPGHKVADNVELPVTTSSSITVVEAFGIESRLLWAPDWLDRQNPARRGRE